MSLPEKKSEGTSPLAPPPGFIYRGKQLHRIDCTCLGCQRAREREAAGRKPRRVLRAERKAARLAQKEAELQAKAAKEAARLEQRASLASALAEQARLTGSTDIAAAARLAKMEPVDAARLAKKEDLITSALNSAGLSVPTVLKSYAEGLEATLTRILVDPRTGLMKDAIKVKDFHAVHKYAHDLLTAHGLIGREEAPPAAGGLFILISEETREWRAPGHRLQCNCRECIDAWNAKAAEKAAELRRQEARQSAIDAEIVSAIDGAPQQPEPIELPEDRALGKSLGQSAPDPDADEDYYQTSPDEPKY